MRVIWHQHVATLIGSLWLMMYSNVIEAGTIDTIGQAPYERCGYCHEYDGNSMSPGYPRLAGQHESYLIKQLEDYKSGKRKGVMTATAELLSDKEIRIVAQYFSQQTLRNSAEDESVDAATKQLYAKGDSARGITACATCHGKQALGGGRMPRLAGQHKAYLVAALMEFKQQQRGNDVAAEMRKIAAHLSEQEIRQLAAYLAQQGR